MYLVKFKRYSDSEYETYKMDYALLSEAEVDKLLIETSGFWMVDDVEIKNPHDIVIEEYENKGI